MPVAGFQPVGESFGCWTHPRMDVDSNQTCSGRLLLAAGSTVWTPLFSFPFGNENANESPSLHQISHRKQLFSVVFLCFSTILEVCFSQSMTLFVICWQPLSNAKAPPSRLCSPRRRCFHCECYREYILGFLVFGVQ